MKRTLCALTATVLLTPLAAFAAPLDLGGVTLDDLLQWREQINDKLVSMDWYPFVELNKKDRGEEVLRLQERLGELLYLSSPPTGNYDDATAKAVQAFQKDNALEGRGAATIETLEALFAAGARAKATPTPKPTPMPKTSPMPIPTPEPHMIGGVDVSWFQSSNLVKLQLDDMTDAVTVTLRKPASERYDRRRRAAVTPSIFRAEVADGSNPFLFTLTFDYAARDWLLINKIIFKTDENRYELSTTNPIRSMGGGKIGESIVLLCGSDALEMIRDILGSAGTKARFSGLKGDYDFDLSKSQLDALEIMFGLYERSGGLAQPFAEIDLFARRQPTTVAKEK